MDPFAFFQPDELEAIRVATRAAEAETAGEIVPYVVGQCDDYPEGLWACLALGALAGTAIGAVLWTLPSRWAWPGPVWMTLPPLLGALLGGLVNRLFPYLGPRLLPGETLDHRVRLRAESAFLSEGVFQTRDRTGILIFVALREHRAYVLADVGIHAKVAHGEWQTIVDQLTAGIKAKRPAAALIEAVQACGRLLVERRFAKGVDDTDELADDVRLQLR